MHFLFWIILLVTELFTAMVLVSLLHKTRQKEHSQHQRLQ